MWCWGKLGVRLRLQGLRGLRDLSARSGLLKDSELLVYRTRAHVGAVPLSLFCLRGVESWGLDFPGFREHQRGP